MLLIALAILIAIIIYFLINLATIVKKKDKFYDVVNIHSDERFIYIDLLVNIGGKIDFNVSRNIILHCIVIISLLLLGSLTFGLTDLVYQYNDSVSILVSIISALAMTECIIALINNIIKANCIKDIKEKEELINQEIAKVNPDILVVNNEKTKSLKIVPKLKYINYVVLILSLFLNLKVF